MLYHLYEMTHAAIGPARAAADSCGLMFRNPLNPLAYTTLGKSTAAACELIERTTRRYKKPAFGLHETEIEGRRVAVREEIVWQRPFCRLIRFHRDLPPVQRSRQPRLLMIAPMSGHYATLLRGTVAAMLPSHDVYITDWEDARRVPLSQGHFDLDDYIDYVAEMIRLFHGDVHVMAVCQPSVPVLAAIADMEARGEPDVPHSMILMGGPIDTRINPTLVNELAQKRGTEWFARTVITSVPWPNAGHGRAVYPGFLQLTGFMTMNLNRHIKAHRDLFNHLVKGDGDSAEKHREFYDEYLAVMDLTAEFYLQTVDSVFVRHELPLGKMTHRGRPITLDAIRRVALMTVEGEKDDITGLGQCAAAHDLCSGLSRSKRLHWEQPKVGHYGIFNGSRYRTEIAPRITAFTQRFDPRTSLRQRLAAAIGSGRKIAEAPRPIRAGSVPGAASHEPKQPVPLKKLQPQSAPQVVELVPIDRGARPARPRRQRALGRTALLDGRQTANLRR